MIRYDLICETGHLFDGWFRDSAAFDEQLARHLLSCPQCGSAKVAKQVMAPRLGTSSSEASDKQVEPAKILEMMRALRRTVEQQADYVGPRFAEEARAMHYAETEKRGIYGEADLEEAKALIEEGIEICPLPRLPEDSH